MNIAELQKKLLAAARANAPDDRVPYAFEKRVLALLAARPVADKWVLWTRGLWQAAASCLAIAVLLGGWIFFNSTASSNSTDLAQNFEVTLLASVDQSDQAP
ncbi:MAG: hypothetical protein ABSA45_01665 [Verrucomicrobiota bacterium]|jgi:hypothetical protein